MTAKKTTIRRTKIRTITLTNDFHRTSVTLRVDVTQHPGNPEYLVGKLSAGQVKKARKALCPSKECSCSQGDAGTRGMQSCAGKILTIVCPQS